MKISPIFIITGNQGEGKTTKIEEVSTLIKNKGLNIFGFYAPGEWKNGLRNRFHLTDVNSGANYLLCYRQEKSVPKNGQFIFIQKTIEKGEQIIEKGLKSGKGIAIIDEIGRFEINGTVWYAIFNRLISNGITVLFTVRQSLVKPVLEKFAIENPFIFNLEEGSDSIADKIISHVTSNRDR